MELNLLQHRKPAPSIDYPRVRYRGAGATEGGKKNHDNEVLNRWEMMQTASSAFIPEEYQRFKSAAN